MTKIAPESLPPISGADPLSPHGDEMIEGASQPLLPYGAAAKAIFVRANGLPAYHRARGMAPLRK